MRRTRLTPRNQETLAYLAGVSFMLGGLIGGSDTVSGMGLIIFCYGLLLRDQRRSGRG